MEHRNITKKQHKQNFIDFVKHIREIDEYCWYDNPYKMGENVFIRYTEKALNDCQLTGAYMAYAIRGQRVSQEVALNIIRKTDVYLASEEMRKLFISNGLNPADYVEMHPDCFIMDWIRSSKSKRAGKGWCHPSGYIGMDGITQQKYPDLCDVLDTWVKIIENITTALDMVVVLTYEDYKIYENFPWKEKIGCGLYIKGNTITLLDDETACEVYFEYDKKYKIPEDELEPEYLDIKIMEQFALQLKQEKEEREKHSKLAYKDCMDWWSWEEYKQWRDMNNLEE